MFRRIRTSLAGKPCSSAHVMQATGRSSSGSHSSNSRDTTFSDGYREAIEEGRNKIFQKYFDEGFADGFKNGFLLGQLKGALRAEQIVDQKDSIHAGELEASSTGACLICKDEKLISLSVTRIQSNQIEVLKKSIVNIKHKAGKND